MRHLSLPWIVCILSIFSCGSFAQEEPIRTESIGDQHFIDIENEESPELHEIVYELQRLRNDPVNINSDEVTGLTGCGLITDYHYRRLAEYRYIYGDLVSLYELAYIEGWDTALISSIIPYLTLEASVKDRFSLREFTGRSKHQLILKSKGILESRKGYLAGMDSPGGPSHYRGSPLAASLRYDMKYHEKMHIGFRLDKDAGEPWFQKNNRNIPLTDHYSGFLMLRDLGIIRALCLGDFRIHFGQGLTISNGSRGRSTPAAVIANGPAVRPHSSIQEDNFMRGAALVIGQKRLTSTLFASSRGIDPSGAELDSSGRPVTFVSFNRSGLHRTATEMLRKKSVKERALGVSLLYSDQVIRAGITCLYAGYDVPLVVDPATRSLFDSSGKRILIAGGQFQVMLRKTHLMAEFSINSNLGKAIVAGLLALPGPGVRAGILFRHYGPGYWNPYGAGFRSYNSNQNENGLYMGMELQLPAYWRADISVDLMNRPRSSFDSETPSNRLTAQMILEKSISSKASLRALLRYGEYFKTFSSANTYHDPYGEMRRVNGRIQLRLSPAPCLELMSGAEILFLDHPLKGNETGFCAYQDFRVILVGGKLKIWIRAGIFETASYDSRIYAFEKDLTYEYTTLAFSGAGFRNAIVASYRPAYWLNLECKAGRLMYEDREFIGSGWEEIARNRKTEWKVQATFRW